MRAEAESICASKNMRLALARDAAPYFSNLSLMPSLFSFGVNSGEKCTFSQEFDEIAVYLNEVNDDEESRYSTYYVTLYDNAIVSGDGLEFSDCLPAPFICFKLLDTVLAPRMRFYRPRVRLMGELKQLIYKSKLCDRLRCIPILRITWHGAVQARYTN